MGRGWHVVSASLAIADDECLHGRRRQGSIGATGQLQRDATAGELTPCPSRPSPRGHRESVRGGCTGSVASFLSAAASSQAVHRCSHQA
eukprot:g76046.t1